MLKQIAVLFTLALPCAHATLLPAGGTVVPSTFTNAGFTSVSPTINGTIAPGTFSATYTVQVFSDTNNTFCSGCLDFVYQVTNNGPGVVERVTMFDFDSFSANVGYIVGAGNIAPVTSNRTVTGGTIAFAFDSTGLLSGKTSDFLVIQTNATNYTAGLFSIQDGSAGTGNGYQPTTTPEPASMFLLGSSLLGVFGFRKKFFGRNL